MSNFSRIFAVTRPSIRPRDAQVDIRRARLGAATISEPHSHARATARGVNRRAIDMGVSKPALCAFGVQFFGYIALSTALELWFYVDWSGKRDSSATHSRKIQRHKRACGTVRAHKE